MGPGVISSSDPPVEDQPEREVSALSIAEAEHRPPGGHVVGRATKWQCANEWRR